MKKHKSLIIALLLVVGLFIYNKSLGFNAIQSSTSQFVSMLKIVPPIFVLIGLMDVWIPRETMIKLMGEKSGLLGIAIAFFFGTFAAGPLIAAFPVAVIMIKKGARYSNVLLFLMTWASAKMPIIFFQITTLGLKFTLVMNITLLTIYVFGTILIEKLLSNTEKAEIVKTAKGMA
ncbi:permease [Clostridium grantii]|uniref:Predicted permease n=1 Tax=Clostridium grantii DSM 8605 TaxID=1121316 RepID=A0A1M5XM43_9CLOT|nr:permease [Clostridium grantii]SHI00816.1 Predicted permease [Clostridium grantii DSM 8605]